MGKKCAPFVGGARGEGGGGGSWVKKARHGPLLARVWCRWEIRGGYVVANGGRVCGSVRGTEVWGLGMRVSADCAGRSERACRCARVRDGTQRASERERDLVCLCERMGETLVGGGGCRGCFSCRDCRWATFQARVRWLGLRGRECA